MHNRLYTQFSVESERKQVRFKSQLTNHPNIWDSLSTLERAATIVHGTAFLFCPKQELTVIKWVLLILDPFVGMRYLEVLKNRVQLKHSNLKLFNIFVLNVTHNFQSWTVQYLGS